MISSDRNVMKNWFRNQSQYWGRGCSRLFNRWKKEHFDEASEIKAEFEEMLKQIQN
jgi:dihydrodipicolinate synthase/N-acetylneuraminate lyase